jgi:hypothetical protein
VNERRGDRVAKEPEQDSAGHGQERDGNHDRPPRAAQRSRLLIGLSRDDLPRPNDGNAQASQCGGRVEDVLEQSD